jgi:hypothetical protein
MDESQQDDFKSATIVVRKRGDDLELSVNGISVNPGSLQMAVHRLAEAGRQDAIDPVTARLYSTFLEAGGLDSVRIVRQVDYSPRQPSALGLRL